MTGIRQSFAFCRERDGYGTGKAETSRGDYNFIHVTATGNAVSGANNTVNTFELLENQVSQDYWIAPPPGSFFSHTSSRAVKRIQTTGSKFWDAQAYGQLQGTWEWTFVLDTEYIEPLFFAFEESTLRQNQTGYDDNPSYTFLNSGGYVSRNYYLFRKLNNARVKSFTVKLVIDDTSVKGGYNELKILKGCVVKDIRFTKGTESSVINVSMSGFYASESLKYASSNPATTYKEPAGDPYYFEWMAAYCRKEEEGDYQYMANVSSTTISVGNSSQAVYSVASPFSANYSEGLTNISMSMSAYYTDPRQYRTLLHTLYSNKYYPTAKGVLPMSRMILLSGSQNVAGTVTYPGVYTETTGTNFPIESFYSQSGRKDAWFDLRNMAVKSLVWEKGDGGSPLQDKIDGNDCQTLFLCIQDCGPQYGGGAGRGLFHIILTLDTSTSHFNGTFKSGTHNGQTRTDSTFYIDASVGAMASATKIYRYNGSTTVATRVCQNLDGWFSSYQKTDLPVRVWGYRWGDTGRDDDQGNDIEDWIWQDVTSEYTNPTASAWLYSSHIAEPFVIPSAPVSTLSMGNPLNTANQPTTDLDDIVLDDRMSLEPNPENGLDSNESLINTDEENTNI